MNPADRSKLFKSLALACGFDAVGITRLLPSPRAGYYRQWLARGHAGSMKYLHRNQALRENPSGLLEGAKSAVCVGLSYKRSTDVAQPPAAMNDPAAARAPARPQAAQQPTVERVAQSPPIVLPHDDRSGSAGEGARRYHAGQPLPVLLAGASGSDQTEPALHESSTPPTGRVAQYARGRDYHHVLREMLDRLLALACERMDEPFDARICVDTAPLLERELAAAAGVGWVGKNTMVLSRSLGSFFFLGELLVTLQLEPDAPQTDHCGTCTRCLDACPTQAFPNAYEMDASRCISYLTIEHRGEIPAELTRGIGDWVYGCDICQEVCPFNRDAPPARHPELAEDHLPARLPLIEMVELRSSAYRRLTKGTAMTRASRKMLRRNAAAALGNAT